MIRAWMIAAVLTVGTVGMLAGVGAAPVASGPVVPIENFAFGQPALAVPVGTTVTWVNHDEELHTVTSAAQVFASPGLDAGESFSYRFTAPGTYTYFCALHPNMTARVVVR
jgi:plastocyanin